MVGAWSVAEDAFYIGIEGRDNQVVIVIGDVFIAVGYF